MVILFFMGFVSLIFIIIIWVRWFRMTSDINRMSRLMEEWMSRNGIELPDESPKRSTPADVSNAEKAAKKASLLILAIMVIAIIIYFIPIIFNL